MPYIQNTDDDRREMLAAVGVSSLEELFAPIPARLRLRGPLPLPQGMTELELVAHLRRLASWNRPVTERPCFLGGGFYDHSWPAVVDAVASRSEFLTTYTPYQPECSQGTLQWTYEFQSLIAALTGMEVANASLYDGASACAEAVLLALSATGRRRVVLSAGLHPHSRETVRTYLRHQDGVEVLEAPLRAGVTAWDGLVDRNTAAVVVQQPNFLGLVEALDEPVALAAGTGALAVASVYPVALGLLRRPGAAGCDVVVGDGQSLGVPLGYGGPSFGFFATRMRHLRRLPGRLAGGTVDRRGRRAFTLTLQTREQHIRREKATSNICTNNALMALRATVFLAALGPEGLRELACACRQRALELHEALLQVDGIEEAFPGRPFFNEIPFRAAGGEPAVARLRARLARAGIAAVLPMRPWYPELAGVFTLACTERTTSESIRRLASAAADALQKEAAR